MLIRSLDYVILIIKW